MKCNWMFMAVWILTSVPAAFAGGPLTWELSEYGGESPYEVLGVIPTSSHDEIKKVYRRLAMRFHPDHHEKKSEPERKDVAEKFKSILAAYEFLSDDEKRANWDQIASWSKAVYSKRNGNSNSNSNSNSNPFEDSWTRWSNASSASGFSRDSASKSQRQTSSMTSMPWYNKGKSYNENFIIAFSSSAADKDLAEWMKASSFDYKPELFQVNLASYFQSVLDLLMQAKLNAPFDSQMKPKIEKSLQALRSPHSGPADGEAASARSVSKAL